MNNQKIPLRRQQLCMQKERQCIWEVQNVKVSKCTGAFVKAAPALSLTPGSFLPLLVLMLSLQIWLNTSPYQKKLKRLLCRISEFIQLTSCQKYIGAKQGQ